MELWLTMKNYGTMEKTMVLWTTLWYYEQNYGTYCTILRTMELRFTKKKHCKLLKTKRLWFIMEKLWKYIKIIEVLSKFIALEFWFTMEKLW